MLEETADGRLPGDPIFIALADVLHRYRLPVQLFFDLLSAFRQDVTRKRYRDFEELLDYCRRSADPVGRLLLHLHGSDSEENLALSDCICTSLQLINFYQDLAQDFNENNRIYIPIDELEKAGVSETHFRERRSDPAMHRLFAAQVARARALMLKGAPLGSRLTGSIRSRDPNDRGGRPGGTGTFGRSRGRICPSPATAPRSDANALQEPAAAAIFSSGSTPRSRRRSMTCSTVSSSECSWVSRISSGLSGSS